MKKFELDVRDLTVSFAGGVPAVDRLSFNIGENTFTALVGESGSGKSVTALSLTRLLQTPLVSGTVCFSEGETSADLLSLSEKDLRSIRGAKIAYIFQDPGTSMNPVLKIGSQMVEACQAHSRMAKSEAKHRALKALSDVRLEDALRVFESYPHQLSGGMKQRAMVAMALITDPYLLIADEATASLDEKNQESLMELLVRLKKERGLSVLFITHDLALAKRFADRIYVMRMGRWVDQDDDYAKKLFQAGLLDGPPKSYIKVG